MVRRLVCWLLILAFMVSNTSGLIIYATPTETIITTDISAIIQTMQQRRYAMSGLVSGSATELHDESFNLQNMIIKTVNMQLIYENALIGLYSSDREEDFNAIIDELRRSMDIFLQSRDSVFNFSSTIDTNTDSNFAAKGHLDKFLLHYDYHVYNDFDGWYYDRESAISTLRDDELRMNMPNILMSLSAYAHAINAENQYNDQVVMMHTAIMRIRDFNGRWTDPDFLREEDKIPMDVMEQLLNSPAGAELMATIQGNRDENTANAIEKSLRNWQNTIQETIAYVEVNNPEAQMQLVEERLLGNPLDFLNIFTGSNVWKVLNDDPNLTFTGTPWFTAAYNPKGLEEGPALRDFYLAAFAASSIYLPFHSQFGDEDYMAALFFLLNAEDDIEEQYNIRNMFSSMSNARKPLYALTDSKNFDDTILGNSYIDMSGRISLLTLNGVLSTINQSGQLSAGIIPGRMISDGDQWSFEHNMIEPFGESGEANVTSLKFEGSRNSDLNGHPIRPVFELDGRGAEPGMFSKMLRTYSNFWSITRPLAAGSFSSSLASWRTDAQFSPSPGTLTSALLENLYQTQMLRSGLSDGIDDTLFLTAVGDVVLGDGTIILPAAANPVYMATPANNRQHWWYNPWTVAFQVSYPQLFGSGAVPFTDSQSDMDKWFLSGLTSETLIGNFGSGQAHTAHIPDKGIWGVVTDSYQFAALPITEQRMRYPGNHPISGLLWPYFTLFNPNLKGVAPVSTLGVEVMSGSISVRGSKEADSLRSRWGSRPLRFNPIRTESGISIFPYIPSASGHTAAANQKRTTARNYIAANMLLYITQFDTLDNTILNWGNDDLPSGNGRLRESFMFLNVALSVLDGLFTPQALLTSIRLEDRLNADNTSFIQVWVNSFSNWILNLSLEVTGFIGVPSPDETSFVAPVYRSIHEYWQVWLLVLTMFLISVWAMSKSLEKVVILAGVLFLATFGMLYLMPRTLPTLLGVPMQEMAGKIIRTTAIVRGEQYAQLFSKFPSAEGMGSIKLFSMSIEEARRTREELNIDPAGFMTNTLWLDDRSGIFFKGTDIRMDLQTLWQHNMLMVEFIPDELTIEQRNALTNIRPSYHAGVNINSYQLLPETQLVRPEMVNYYMPFLFLQDGLVETLNTFLWAYEIPNSVLIYPDGTVRSGYIISTFIKSYPFLAVLPQVQHQLIELDVSGKESALIMEHFPDPGDIFKLQWLVTTEWKDLPTYVANTIWGQSMLRNGFYDNELGEIRRQTLVNVTNDAFYEFILSVQPEIGLLSDDNLIKMATLFATFAFNDHISRFGNMVYPRNFAMDELSVGDLFSSVVVHSSGRFMLYDIDAMPILRGENGLPGELAGTLILIAMMILAFINGIFAEMTYLGVVIALILTALIKRSIKPALLFAVKIMAVFMAIAVLSIFTLHSYYWLPATFRLYIVMVGVWFLVVFSIKSLLWCFKSTSFIDAGRAVSIDPFRRVIRGSGITHQAYGNGFQYQENYYYQEEPQQEYEDHKMPGMKKREKAGRDYSSF